MHTFTKKWGLPPRIPRFALFLTQQSRNTYTTKTEMLFDSTLPQQLQQEALQEDTIDKLPKLRHKRFVQHPPSRHLQ